MHFSETFLNLNFCYNNNKALSKALLISYKFNNALQTVLV